MKLASYDKLPMSLARASTSADVEAELVDIGGGTADTDYTVGVKGKIVLTSANPMVMYERAVNKEGALGIVSSWSAPDFDQLNRRPGDFPDQVGWPRVPGKEAEGPGRFAFALSARRAQELRTTMRQGKAVRVHAIVDAELVPGNLEVVTGLIPGSTYPDEEIIVTAHLDHYKPGANDNASGSAAILEMARAMRQLIENKELPQPLRTIRFMWVPEYNGTYAWISAHLNDPVKRLANLNFDMVGENVLKTNSVTALCYTSDSNPSYLNALMESIVDFGNSHNSERYPPQMDLYIGSIRGSRNRMACPMIPYITGTDHGLFNNLKIGAMTLGSWPDNFYHSSEDSPDKVDPTELHRAVVIGLAAITTIAYADNEQAQDFARLSLVYGRRRIAGTEFSAIQALLSATKDGFGEANRLAENLMAHVYGGERAAIGSAAAFARTAKARSDVEKTMSLRLRRGRRLMKRRCDGRACYGSSGGARMRYEVIMHLVVLGGLAAACRGAPKQPGSDRGALAGIISIRAEGSMRRDVTFRSEGADLSGWLYLPDTKPRWPPVIMAHGFSAPRSMTADKYAEMFRASGLAVLLYDHRGFGDSGGEPRLQVNPWVQAREYRDAISYASDLAEIDVSKIGLWGDSFSGGVALAVAAVDPRVAALVIQVPALGSELPPEDASSVASEPMRCRRHLSESIHRLTRGRDARDAACCDTCRIRQGRREEGVDGDQRRPFRPALFPEPRVRAGCPLRGALLLRAPNAAHAALAHRSA
jgi:dienelactone hydrolase